MVTGGRAIEIDGYDDFTLIGSGGFASVYQATQLSIGREVAIKLLTDPSPDADLVRRFARESKAVGALSWHPHIAAVVDAGATASGQAYIAFELLTGGSLDTRIKFEPLEWRPAVTLMVQVADAVEAAHRAGVLHRDIKPANILLSRLGDAKLADFGIASMQDGNKTETGMLATTISHAAPELFSGEPSSVATDVYALGSTLHNLLSGKPPFANSSSEPVAGMIGRITSQPPTPLDADAVPGEVSSVIYHALAKQPDFRIRSAAAFGQALQLAQRSLGETPTAMPVTDADPTPAAEAASTAPPTVTAQASDNTSAPAPAKNNASLPSPKPDAAAALTSGRSGTATSGRSAQTPPSSAKPLARTIAVLSAIAGLLAAILVGAFLFQQFGSGSLATTLGGVEVSTARGFDQTTAPGSPAAEAFDNKVNTFWGIQPGAEEGIEIVGSTIRIELNGQHSLSRVGIQNGTDASFSRVKRVLWAASDEGLQSGSAVEQTIPDESGPFMIDVEIVTDEVVMLITELHEPATARAGIAEILLEGE